MLASDPRVWLFLSKYGMVALYERLWAWGHTSHLCTTADEALGR